MSVTLTTTWKPQGELPRLQRYLPVLQEIYEAIIIVTSPGLSDDVVDPVRALPDVLHYESGGVERARSLCLVYALKTDAATIHYCDMDRMIRWVELYEDELRRVVAAMQGHDAVMLERTPYAWETHPQALQATEAIILDVAEMWLGQRLDLTSGSKAFSRDAAAFLSRHDGDTTGPGTDLVWPLLLHQAGYTLTGIQTDALDWETADRFREVAADPETQAAAAAAYDADAARWHMRVDLARHIIQAATMQIQRGGLS
jgi:hypothetical protein